MTIERPMFPPRGSSRRGFLSVANNPPDQPMTRDDELGIIWWNSLTKQERAEWSAVAGNTGRPKDAWEAFKRGSRSPPVDQARRRFLAVAAGASVASVGALAVAGIPTSDDPAFALIAAKRAADAAHCEAIDTEDEIEARDDFSSDDAIEAQDNSEAACLLVHEVDWKLATTLPTTLAGIAAVLRFANEIEDAGNEWPDTDTVGREGWHYQLRATMAAALEALIKAEGGKAVRS
jgi:hypothetical protein